MFGPASVLIWSILMLVTPPALRCRSPDPRRRRRMAAARVRANCIKRRKRRFIMETGKKKGVFRI
jgi:hypothetical protein